MEKSKRNLVFIVINVLLVAVIGVVLGICLPISTSPAAILSLTMLLVTLACPTFLFLFCKNANSPIGIASILVLVGNLVTTAVFLFTVDEIKIVAITEAAIVGAYLVAVLISLACTAKKE